jgi:hypothetical protein
MDPTKACTDVHAKCCDSITKLKTLKGKVPADVQTVLDAVVQNCKDCCDSCKTVATSLPPTP